MMEDQVPWNCEEALRHLALHLDGELDSQDQAFIEVHLNRCRGCWSRFEFERRLKKWLAELGREPVPPDLSGRIAALISAFPVSG
jgi:anti-sigma factor (TIGR02949 family)